MNTRRLGQVEHGDDDDGDEEDAQVRLPAILRPFVGERRGRFRHTPHRERAVDIVGIVFVEGTHG